MAFKGMRWFKCDFQMQTPADARNWVGSEKADAAGATAFIDRCHEVGLEVIAITDHNYASQQFIELLRTANTGHSGRPPLLIFPGFELEADIGKGVHALAIFDQDTNLEYISHVLTDCGVLPPRFVNGVPKQSTHKLDAIIEKVQTRDKDDRLEGLVVCAHIHSDRGLFDNDSLSEWLQQREWKNQELYAVEVAKPIERMKPTWQALFANDQRCMEDWRRIRPIGRFSSSDCKSLDKVSNDHNWVGRRYCWVKMSEPSVEALRQACLDHESRICLHPNGPPIRHTHIRSIKIRGAQYLQDMDLELSPHLNAIIGGRGSGKSTLLEYLRIALRAYPVNFDPRSDTISAKQRRRMLATLLAGATTEVVISYGGLEDTVTIKAGSGQGELTSRSVSDQATVFRQYEILAFSQDEITELAKGSNFLALIDSQAGSQLAENSRKADEVGGQIRTAITERDAIATVEAELPSLRQQLDELTRQLDAVSRVQNVLTAQRQAETDAAILQQLDAEVQDISAQGNEFVEQTRRTLTGINDRNPDGARAIEIKAIRDRIVGLTDSLVTTVDTALRGYHGDAQNRQEPARVAVQQAINQARDEFTAACVKEGISREEAERLSELVAKQGDLVAEIGRRERSIVQRKARLVDVGAKITELVAVWKDRTKIRLAVIEAILKSDTMPKTKAGKPIVEPKLDYAADRAKFLELWSSCKPSDGRTRLSKVWEDDTGGLGLGSVVFDAYHEAPGSVGSPFFWLQERLDNPTLAAPELLTQYRGELAEYIKNDRDRWLRLKLTRCEDGADLVLLRSDGTTAGSLGNKKLSDGHQNTAILSLLLAQGTGPVLIDQPETELDSAFLYDELIPMLRHAKVNRQLIIVTHNPNIPVNGDAELVLALESRDGRGVNRAEGGLDRHSVTTAVLDLMEGSREAFRRRQEKYYFGR